MCQKSIKGSAATLRKEHVVENMRFHLKSQNQSFQKFFFPFYVPTTL